MQKLLQIKKNGFTLLTAVMAFLVFIILGAGLLGICLKSQIFSVQSESDNTIKNPTDTPVCPAPVEAAPEISIRSILYSPDLASIVIDGKIYHEGDSINDDIIVVKIFDDRVIFEKKDADEPQRWTQKIR